MAHQRSTARRPNGGRQAALPGTPRSARPRLPTADVIWVAPFYNVSGYADEARSFVSELGALGTTIAAKAVGPASRGFLRQLERDTPRIASAVSEALHRTTTDAKMAVLHVTGDVAQQIPGPGPTVVRTMYETDGLPAQWVEHLNLVDEVWVPTAFNRQSFRTAGVTSEIHVVPGGVDTSWFRPDLPPLALPTRASTTFLSIFEWSHRKAPDVLLRAWVEAFDPLDDVALVLRCFPRGHFGDTDATAMVDRLVDGELRALGRSRRDVAPVVVLGQHLSPDELRRLVCSTDVYVSPTRGEGWGRPLVEAQACGKLVITTKWGAPGEILDPAAALLVDVDGLEHIDEHMDVAHYQGQRWASPSTSHLVELLRWSASHPDERASMGRRGREDMVRRWSWSSAATVARERIDTLTRPSWSRAKGRQPRSTTPSSHGLRSPAMASEVLSRSGPEQATSPVIDQLTAGSGGVERPPAHARQMPPVGADQDLQPLVAASRITPEQPIVRGEDQPVVRSQHMSLRPLVRFEGDVAARHSLARVNRELCRALVRMPVAFTVEAVSGEPEVARGGGPAGFTSLPGATGPCVVEVRHHWPPNLARPRGDHLVLAQPWEFGVVPRTWIQPILDHASEVWTFSAASRQCFVSGGIPAERVVIVPLGVERSVFGPDGPGFTFKVPASRRFLYVGGTIDRKGFDIALTAYLNTFTRAHDVAFVVKPFLSGAQYRGMNSDDILRTKAADPRAARIEVVDRDLEDDELAALYRSCDVLLAPYRGEGFGLHILEAMACGTPAVVTAGGGADEFCDDDTSWMIPAAVQPLQVDGFEPATGSFTVLEPDRRLLAAAMRRAVTDHRDLAARAEAGVARSSRWTWEHTAAVAARRIDALTTAACQPEPVKIPPTTETAQTQSGETAMQNLSRLVTDALTQVHQLLSSQQASIDALHTRIEQLERQLTRQPT